MKLDPGSERFIVRSVSLVKTVGISSPGAARDVTLIPRFGPYQRIHHLLRGRYRYIVPLMFVLGLAGAVYGYRSKRPLYSSEGLIRISPNLPAVMQSTDQNAPLNMYSEYCQSQVLLLKSRPVLQLAAADPQWKARSGNAPMIGELDVLSAPHSESITIDYTWTDPQIAAAGVRAVIGAYMRLYDQTDQSEQRRRLQVLIERKQELTRQITQFTRQMQEAAVIPPISKIALHDDLMSSLLAERQSMQAELAEWYSRGCGPNEPQVKDISARLAVLDQRMEAYRQEFGREALAKALRPTDNRQPTYLFPELRGMEKSLDALSGDLNETSQRLDALTTEARLGLHRVTVQDWGEPTAVPAFDERRSAAGLYGIIGGIAPLMLFMFFGLAERRLRFSEQVQDSPERLPLLAVIPELNAASAKADVERISAQCIHTLRLSLLPTGRSNPHRLFTVASASAGEGKTSLTLGLGFSFAGAGMRTLLIDCDLVGRGLTRRLNQDNAEGLSDCLGAVAQAKIAQVVSNLWLLPAGRTFALDGTAITPAVIRELAGAVGSAYDVVLVDTGPILGSPEASVVAQVADRVILVIAQGQQQKDVRRAMQAMQLAGVRMAGMVFNRAAPEDYFRSIGGVSNASYRPRSQKPRAAGSAPSAPASITVSGQNESPVAERIVPADATPRHNPHGADGSVFMDTATIATEPTIGELGFVPGSLPAKFTLFSDQPLTTEPEESPPSVMTVINGPPGAPAEGTGAGKGFADRRVDDQMDAASQPAAAGGKPAPVGAADRLSATFEGSQTI